MPENRHPKRLRVRGIILTILQDTNGTKLSKEQIREFGSDRDVTATAEVRDIHLTP